MNRTLNLNRTKIDTYSNLERKKSIMQNKNSQQINYATEVGFRTKSNIATR